MRATILLTYKIVGPLLLALFIAETLSEFGIIEMNERTMPGPLYTLYAVLMFGIVFASPLFLIGSIVILWRYRTDWPVTLPALMLLLFFLFFPLAFLWPDAPNDLVVGLMSVGSIGFALAAIWAGWFAGRKAPV